MNNDNYYNKEGISQSLIKKFIESKELYKAIYIDKKFEDKDTDSKRFGRLYHTYLYEFDKLRDLYKVVPLHMKIDGMMGKFIEGLINNTPEESYKLSGFEQSFETTWKSFEQGKNSGKYKTYHNLLLQASGKTIISDLDKNIVKKMKEVYIRDNEHLQKALRDNWYIFPEQEIFFKSNYSILQLKMKADCIYINPDFSKVIIEDAKTTEDLNLKEFVNTVKKYRYDIQQSFYKTGVQHWIEEKFNEIIPYENIEFIFIPQRKVYPYDILDFIELDYSSENRGYTDWTTALVELEYCMTTGNWSRDKSCYDGNRRILKIWY